MTRTPAQPMLDTDLLRASIRDEYATVATEPERGFHFHTGRSLAALLGYPEAWIDALPQEAVASMAGTGNPFALGEIRPGERVVDCGSGAGADAIIAAQLVGAGGHVIGVDMTPAMLDTARRAATAAHLENVEFREGYLEALPIDDAWADVIISNGVLNLVPNKAAALAEIHRVLRPGGRLQAADIILDRPVSVDSKQDVSLWTGCIAGGLLGPELAALITAAGFVDVTMIPGGDVFAGAAQHSNAADYGAIGVGLRAVKPDAAAGSPLARRERG